MKSYGDSIFIASNEKRAIMMVDSESLERTEIMQIAKTVIDIRISSNFIALLYDEGKI